MFCLLVDQGRVHLEQSRLDRCARVFHPGKPPERITFVNQCERAFALQRAADCFIGLKALLFSESRISPGWRRDTMQPNMFMAGGRRPVATRREEVDLHALPAQ